MSLFMDTFFFKKLNKLLSGIFTPKPVFSICKLKLISEKMNILKKSGTFDFDYGF